MTIFILTTAVVVTAVASHTHYHFRPPFKQPDKPIVPPACRTLTWKELLAHGTSVHFRVRSQRARSEKISQLYFLDWTLLHVLAKGLHITDHLFLGVCNPQHPQHTSLIQNSHPACCHFVIKNKGHPAPLKIAIKFYEHFPIPYTVMLILIPSIPSPFE